MNIMCRLCSSSNNLLDVFHPKLENRRKLRRCILLASGIHIKKEDLISTMVCLRCCEIAVKLHKYRINAITNDQLLKQKCGQRYTPPIMDPDELTKAAAEIDAYVNNEFQQKDPSDLLSTYLHGRYEKTIINKDSSYFKTHNNDKSIINETIVSKNNSAKSVNICDIFGATAQISSISIRRVINKHPSVKKLFSEYKNIVLPVEVYSDDISPLVSLDKNDVNNWYANKKSTSKEKLDVTVRNSPVSFTVSESSNDSDIYVLNSRLRKRTNRRIIIDSNSDDDIEYSSKPPKISKTASVSLPKTIEHVEETVTVPTSSSSLNITGSIQTNLDKLFTDFNKYGINFENSEPPIETCTVEENPIILVDENSDVICVTDEQPSNTYLNTDGIYSEVKSLFKSHYVFSYKPLNTGIHLTQKGIIILRNMAHELKKYHIPVELEYCGILQAKVLKRSSLVPPSSNDINLWSYKDCTDIIKPTGQTVRINPVASVNNSQSNTTSTSNITEQNKAPPTVVNGSMVPNNQIMQSMILTKSGHLLKKRRYTVSSISQASTTQTLLGPNNPNVYNVTPLNQNGITKNIPISSNTNSNVCISNESMPPLVPITTSLTTIPTVSNSIIPLSVSSINGNDQATVQLTLYPSQNIAMTNLPQPPGTGLRQIRKILPKTDENSANTVFKTWHQVQSSQPSQLSTQATPQQTSTQPTEKPPPCQQPSMPLQQQSNVVQHHITQHTPGAIRVKNLSELVKN